MAKLIVPSNPQTLQNNNTTPQITTNPQLVTTPQVNTLPSQPIKNTVPVIKGAILESFDKGKKKSTQPVKEYDFGNEMINLSNKLLPYDNQTAPNLIKQVSTETGIKPSLLYSSAYIEGMNKAAANPDDISEAYATLSEKDQTDFPVDGFYNYGLDTFGTRFNDLKKYLPVGFENRFKTFQGKNEKGGTILTAAFKTNKDALIAKSAMLKSEQDNVLNYAKANGINLDEDAKDYFTMASYNSGFGNARKMIDEYKKSPNKQSFINNGETSLKGVHTNVSRRMKLRQTATNLLNKS